MDFPFVKRFSRHHLMKHPEDKGKDAEITKKACEKFKYFPTAIINFVEGTRFTEEKRNSRNSPYKNLLSPKAGGVSLVMDTMGKSLTKIIDVTIAYPQGNRSSWEFLKGRITSIKINVETLPVPIDIIKLYTGSDEDQKKVHDWLNAIWANKDRRLSVMTGNA
jgi:1-acyl-sn-glycerol-3-phosphate acyltransferase